MAKVKKNNVFDFAAESDNFGVSYYPLEDKGESATVTVYNDAMEVVKEYKRFVPMPVINGRGEMRYSSNGHPRYKTVSAKFTKQPRTPAQGPLSIYHIEFKDTDTPLQKAQKEEILRCLMKSSDNAACVCNTLDNHNKNVNPEAHAELKRREQLENEIETMREENEKLKSEKESQKSALDKLNAELQRVTGKQGYNKNG